MDIVCQLKVASGWLRASCFKRKPFKTQGRLFLNNNDNNNDDEDNDDVEDYKIVTLFARIKTISGSSTSHLCNYFRTKVEQRDLRDWKRHIPFTWHLVCLSFFKITPSNVRRRFLRCRDSNGRSIKSETTFLPTVPQIQSFPSIWSHFAYTIPNYIEVNKPIMAHFYPRPKYIKIQYLHPYLYLGLYQCDQIGRFL